MITIEVNKDELDLLIGSLRAAYLEDLRAGRSQGPTLARLSRYLADVQEDLELQRGKDDNYEDD